MSELKVDKISALGTGVNVSNPVGIRTAAPTAAGDALYVNGNTDVIGAVEVVTVQAENYGVRIKAPTNNTNSILQFTNNAGVQRAFVSADANNNLLLGSGTQNRVSIDGNSGLLSALFASDFVGDANFRSALNAQGNSTFNGQATFNNTVPLCSIVPTLGSHLVNLDYLNTTASKVYVVGMNETGARTNTHTLSNVAAGSYAWITILGLHNERDFGGTIYEYMYLTASGNGGSVTNYHDQRFSKEGGRGHYYVKAGAEVAFGILNLTSKGNVTINYSRVTNNGGEYGTEVSYVGLLIKT